MRFTLTVSFIDLGPAGRQRLEAYRARQAACNAPPGLDPSFEARFVAVGSKWDAAALHPFVAEELTGADQVRVGLDELSVHGARLSLEWPATLPLGELVQVQLEANELSRVRCWCLVEAARACPAGEARACSAGEEARARSVTPARRTSDPAPPSPGAARAA